MSDTASITGDRTGPVVKNSGNSKHSIGGPGAHIAEGQRARESAKNARERKDHTRKTRSSVEEERARQLPRGGRIAQGATGENPVSKKVGENASSSKLDPVARAEAMGRKSVRRKDIGRSRSAIATNRTADGGSGRKNVAKSYSLSREARRVASTGAGSSTSRSPNRTEPRAVSPPRLDIGDDSRATLLVIISKLFPLDMEMGSSPCEPRSSGDQASGPRCSCVNLAALEHMENNFQDLVMWFESLEGTRARDSIGFALAMELCGCYDLAIRNLASALRSTFEKCSFIKSTHDIARADWTLKSLAKLVNGERFGELENLADQMRCVPGPNRETIGDLIVKLQGDSSRTITLCDIEETSEGQWRTTTELVRVLLSTVHELARQLSRGSDECLAAREELDRVKKSNGEACHRLQGELDGVTRSLERLNCEREQLQCEIGILSEEREVENQKHCSVISERVEQVEQMRSSHGNEIGRLALAHEKDRLKWRDIETNLLAQIEGHEQSIRTLSAERTRELLEYQHSTESLVTHKDKLASDLELSRRDLEEHKREMRSLIETAQQENAALSEELAAQRALNGELSRAIGVHSERERELTDTLQTLTGDLRECETVRRKSLELETSLCALQEFLGVDVRRDTRTALDEIANQRDASALRMERVLRRTCVRFSSEDDKEHVSDETQSSVSPVDTCELFKQYENQILDAVRNLNVEHSPMDVSECKRVIKTPVKRKPDFQHLMLKRDKSIRRKLKLDIKTEAEARALSVPETTHTNIHSFDVEIVKGENLVSAPVPKYIAEELIERGRVTIVKLGSENPVETLLHVLQTEQRELKACCEITQNSCHCQEFTRLSDRLKCAIVIGWTPGGGCEFHGVQYKDSCLYTIVVHKRENVRTYYMIAVKEPNGSCSYVYDLSKLSFTPHFLTLNRDSFVHAPVNCCGPHERVRFGTCNVHVLETSEIVLKGTG